ncbi:MAG: hypothetical protein RIG62_00485 [Cyclobacteriaceae bacterium]
MKSLYFITCILLPSLAVCQTQEEDIASVICSNLSELDLTEAPATLNQKSLAIIQKVYQDFQPRSAELFVAYREMYKGKSDLEISKLIGQQVTVHLMDECVAYQRITMFNAQPVPKITETARQIGKEFTTLFTERMKSGSITQTTVGECVTQVTNKNAHIIEKVYGDPQSPKFIEEFLAYLMTDSMPYMKWMASQIR